MPPLPRPILTLLLLGWIGGTFGCATAPSTVPKPSVRHVDFRRARHAAALAEQARLLGNQLFPKVRELWNDGTHQAPEQFSIVFRERLPRGVPAQTRGTTVFLSSTWLAAPSGDQEWYARSATNLAPILVHEMAHVLQRHPHRNARHWIEGLADYTRYKLLGTNGWARPRCDSEYPHYTSGYWCAGAFLLHLDEQHGPTLIRHLHSTLLDRRYSDRFFLEHTGQSLEGLWTKFKKSPRFAPDADNVHAVQQALGYRAGVPPRNLQARFDALLRQHPGGNHTVAALRFLRKLHRTNQLPGFTSREPLILPRGERGRFPFLLPPNTDPAVLPTHRLVYAYKPNGDPSVYWYDLKLAPPGTAWTLVRAFRATPDGKTLEEYPLP